MTGKRGLDLLRTPVLGRFLRWRHARTVAQTLILGLTALVVIDGLWGPQLAHRNWAGTLPWVQWRGLVILALLVAGNVFCFACPFMLPRRLAKRLFPAERPWPTRLRSKWLAAALLVLFFWSYEAFDLWASPWLTAWVIVGYFLAAFVVDAVFRGAAFCKHLCPIGQFHFVHSTLSPLEVRVREADRCASCTGKECITGNSATRQSGCETWLFQPRKVGNLDCTFCLDCVQACPHDNVGILSREPGRELWEDPWRSSIGRLSERPDMAALALVLVFAAFVNAFGMTAPVFDLLDAAGDRLGVTSPLLLTGVLFFTGLVILPLAFTGAAALAGRVLGREEGTLPRIVSRYAWSLVPVGFGMWAAHYLYHFLLSGLSVIPVGQQYLRDLGLPSGGAPRWGLGPLLPEAWVLPIELLILETGFLVSLVVAHRIGVRMHGTGAQALRAALPWMIVAALLSGAGIWLLLQPMEMRGGFPG